MPSTQQKKNRRWRLWANSKIQGPLLMRVVLYWVGFELIHFGTSTAMLLLSNGEPPNGISSFIPPMVMTAIALPIILFDVLQLSNRIVGPMVQINRKAKALAAGEQVGPVSTRPGDFFGETAEALNQIRERLETQHSTDRVSKEVVLDTNPSIASAVFVDHSPNMPTPEANHG